MYNISMVAWTPHPATATLDVFTIVPTANILGNNEYENKCKHYFNFFFLHLLCMKLNQGATIDNEKN